MPDLLIADVSEWQGAINWPAYPSPAAVVRLNYGAFYPDRQAGTNIAGARARCKVRGWYTYLVAGQAPEPQADALADVLLAHGGLLAGEFIACDDEEGSGDQAPRVHAYFDRLHSRFHEAADQDWVYAGLYFARTHLGSLKGYHRWLAAYGAGEMGDQHDLWQFTSSGQVAGINGNVDISIFHGTIEQLAALVGGVPPPDEEDDDMAVVATPGPDKHNTTGGGAIYLVGVGTAFWLATMGEVNDWLRIRKQTGLIPIGQYPVDRLQPILRHDDGGEHAAQADPDLRPAYPKDFPVQTGMGSPDLRLYHRPEAQEEADSKS